MKKLIEMGVVCLALLFCQIAINAQTTGTLTGTVTDPKGDVVAGANVAAKNLETGEERTGSTNDKGAFTFGQIPPGTYTVTVESAGFKRSVATNVKVDVSSDASISVALEIGGVGETVTVTSAQDVI